MAKRKLKLPLDIEITELLNKRVLVSHAVTLMPDEYIKKSASEFVKHLLTPKDDHLKDQETEALAKAKQEQLRIAGKALEADLLQLKTQHDKRLAEIKRAAQEEVAASPTEVKKIRSQESKANAAEDQSYEQGVAQAKATAEREQAAKHLEIQQQLHQGHIEALEKEAELGNKAAGQEAERLKIIDQYAKRKAEILQLSKGASEADRAALKAESEQLDAQQRKALAFAQVKSQISQVSEPARQTSPQGLDV